MRKTVVAYLVLVFLVSTAQLGLALAAGQDGGSGAQVDPKADEVLRQMCDYMFGLEQFSFKALTSIDDLRTDYEQITHIVSSMVFVKRPDRIHAKRYGEEANVELYYDGKTVSVYSEEHNYYAQRNLRGDLGSLFDHLFDALDADVPGAEFIYEDAYEGLMADVESGTYVGEVALGGFRCHHLAFRTPEVDWQIWVDVGENPLPRRYIIISKWMAGGPRSVVEMSDWDVSSRVPDSEFEFTPPKGAMRIVFLEDGTPE